MPHKIKARCKFDGRFPDTKTCVSFTAQMPGSGAALMAAPLIKMFLQVMAETYPDPAIRPGLRKLTITINFP